MQLALRKRYQIFGPNNSLRRMVGYSLIIARLILVPVIFLAIYYLFKMGFIVDKIVNVDAPAATLAQQASIQMLEARRAERNYLLLRDSAYLEPFHLALSKLNQTLEDIKKLDPTDKPATDNLSSSFDEYQQTFAGAVVTTAQQGMAPSDRVRTVVRAYEKDINDLINSSKKRGRARLMEDLRKRVDSFDSQISETVQQDSPALRQITDKLQSSSENFLRSASQLEHDNWSHVELDRAQAKKLLRQAEWALSLVSCVTLFFSVWVSFTLPRQVVKPLTSLREAIDHASSGNYELQFDIHGKGEVVELAKSLQRLLSVVRPLASGERTVT
jgi:CHASE3 domain sensor protein